MAAPPRDPARVAEFSRLLVEHGGNCTAACEAFGIPRGSGAEWLKAVRKADLPDGRGFTAAPPPIVPVAAPLPDAGLSAREIIEYQKRRFERRAEHLEAKRWRRFQVPANGPYGLWFFGDPHLDDNGCNWPLLERHIELCQSVEHIYAVNIGDTTNNWAGRLARLWANQDTSAETARTLAKWFLGEAGVPWFLWLHGNHDLWDGPVGAAWFEAVKPHFVEMENWQAKVTLVSPCGHELRLWVAHNFPGHSQWNALHGPMKAAQMKDWAHLYVAGHHHNWGLAKGEHEHRRFTYDIVRVRGYKFGDDRATELGFGEHEDGASILAVVEPSATKPGVVTCFADVERGADYLRYLQTRLKAG